MKTQPITNDTSSANTLVTQAMKDLVSLKWLTPLTSLRPKKSVDFGRKIEASLNELTNSQHIMKLQLRKSDKAVVIGVDQYQSILDMKRHYESLVERVRELELSHEANEYDQLFERIASPASRKAVDILFNSTDEDFNNAYKE